MMRKLILLLALCLLTGCSYRLPVYVPDVQIRPSRVGHGAHFSVRLWGAEIADYAFMGASQQPDGAWLVRIDPVFLGMIRQASSITVREGDILPLGPGPAVLVEFVALGPTEIQLRAVGVHMPADEF